MSDLSRLIEELKRLHDASRFGGGTPYMNPNSFAGPEVGRGRSDQVRPVRRYSTPANPGDTLQDKIKRLRSKKPLMMYGKQSATKKRKSG